MATVKIDDVEYAVEDLSTDAKAQIQAIQATDARIAETTQELAILQTAKNAYSQALRELLLDIPTATEPTEAEKADE